MPGAVHRRGPRTQFTGGAPGRFLFVSPGDCFGDDCPSVAIVNLCLPAGSSNWFKQKMDMASHWGTYTYNRDIRDLVACGAVCGVW